MDIQTIIIVAIVCIAIVSISKGRAPSKKNHAVNDELRAEHAQMQHEIAAMAQRVAVLEKIVTDEKYQLNRQFDAL